MKYPVINLIVALGVAIEAQEREEKSVGYTSDSALLAGWKIMHEILLKKAGAKIDTAQVEFWLSK